MGPYCEFCDFRCFVVRVLPGTREQILMATCLAGMDHDREVTGHDHRTALNPSKVEAPAVAVDTPMLDLERNLERARATAVALEQENAEIVRLGRAALAALPTLGDCSCVGFDGCDDQGDDVVIDREQCDYCQVAALLHRIEWVVNPIGCDRLLDALFGGVEEVAGA